jgi:hypothetical protein
MYGAAMSRLSPRHLRRPAVTRCTVRRRSTLPPPPFLAWAGGLLHSAAGPKRLICTNHTLTCTRLWRNPAHGRTQRRTQHFGRHSFRPGKACTSQLPGTRRGPCDHATCHGACCLNLLGSASVAALSKCWPEGGSNSSGCGRLQSSSRSRSASCWQHRQSPKRSWWFRAMDQGLGVTWVGCAPKGGADQVTPGKYTKWRAGRGAAGPESTRPRGLPRCRPPRLNRGTPPVEVEL